MPHLHGEPLDFHPYRFRKLHDRRWPGGERPCHLRALFLFRLREPAVHEAAEPQCHGVRVPDLPSQGDGGDANARHRGESAIVVPVLGHGWLGKDREKHSGPHAGSHVADRYRVAPCGARRGRLGGVGQGRRRRHRGERVLRRRRFVGVGAHASARVESGGGPWQVAGPRRPKGMVQTLGHSPARPASAGRALAGLVRGSLRVLAGAEAHCRAQGGHSGHLGPTRSRRHVDPR
mmetsp:Transcript_82516/g.238392  ORF Transcript_82516/g.238392 Transcript_82516/m.238392 type:complete len:233 (+) Transcript_82516:1660-2358(+)